MNADAIANRDIVSLSNVGNPESITWLISHRNLDLLSLRQKRRRPCGLHGESVAKLGTWLREAMPTKLVAKLGTWLRGHSNVNDYRLRVRASSIARRMSAISWFASLVDRASLTGASSGSFPATLAKRVISTTPVFPRTAGCCVVGRWNGGSPRNLILPMPVPLLLTLAPAQKSLRFLSVSSRFYQRHDRSAVCLRCLGLPAPHVLRL